jgi:Lrp/AsnC family leucine-responsive transcriptional regulator
MVSDTSPLILHIRTINEQMLTSTFKAYFPFTLNYRENVFILDIQAGNEAMKSENLDQLDRFDEQILAVLSVEGRLPVTDLARRIGISKSPCQVRLKRLQQQGYIKGFRAIVDPVKLGREHVAFVEVRLSDTRELALRAFNQAVLRIPEVEQCHMIAGSFDYLLKVRTADIRSFRRTLGESITLLPHVANTSSFVTMESVKDLASYL